MAQSTDTINYGIFSISAFQHFSMGTSTTRTTSSMRRIGNLRGIRFTYVSQHQQKGRPWAQAGSITRTLWGGVATRHETATQMMALAESLASKELEDVA